jgi:hypothetical protein
MTVSFVVGYPGHCGATACNYCLELEGLIAKMAAAPEFRAELARFMFHERPELFAGMTDRLTEAELKGGQPLGVPELAGSSILHMLNLWIYSTGTPLSAPVPLWKALADNHGPVPKETLALLMTQAGPIHLFVFSHRHFAVARPGAFRSGSCMRICFANTEGF